MKKSEFLMILVSFGRRRHAHESVLPVAPTKHRKKIFFPLLTEVRETIFSIRILKFPWVALEEQKRGWGCGNGSFLNLFYFFIEFTRRRWCSKENIARGIAYTMLRNVR